jgi:hypothetical protein
VPIPEDEKKKINRGMEKPYNDLLRFEVSLPHRLRQKNMHLDPDFEHLTYGDVNNKADRIQEVLSNSNGDFIVFYSGMRDVNPNKKCLVYAIVGFYEIDEIIPATKIPRNRWDENAHTRCTAPGKDEIVVRAKQRKSGRLERCIPIGCYRPNSENPNGRPQYRVNKDILEEWGGLSVNDGWLQRSAYLPEFKDAERFIEWFRKQKPTLVAENN